MYIVYCSPHCTTSQLANTNLLKNPIVVLHFPSCVLAPASPDPQVGLFFQVVPKCCFQLHPLLLPVLLQVERMLQLPADQSEIVVYATHLCHRQSVRHPPRSRIDGQLQCHAIDHHRDCPSKLTTPRMQTGGGLL